MYHLSTGTLKKADVLSSLVSLLHNNIIMAKPENTIYFGAPLMFNCS